MPRFWNSNIPFSLTVSPFLRRLRRAPDFALSHRAGLHLQCCHLTVGQFYTMRCFLRPLRVRAQRGFRWVERGN